MNKVYLLLRNNQQTGPHSLEELLQLGLKPKDLIWVEGKSCGWSYPHDVDALKLYSPQPIPEPANTVTKQPAPEPAQHQPYIPGSNASPKNPEPAFSQKVYVRLPANAAPAAPPEPTPDELLEQKAEALRRRAQSYVPGQTSAPETPVIENRYTRPLEDVEEEYTAWVYQQKSTRRNKGKQKSAGLAAAAVLALAAGYFFMQNGSSPTVDAGKAADKLMVNETTFNATATGQQENADNKAATEATTAPTVKATAKMPTEKEPANNRSAAKTKTTTVTTPIKKNNHIAIAAPPESPFPADENTDTDNAAPTTDTKEKKKTIGQKIDGFFEKLKSKKPEAAVAKQSEAAPATKDDRKAKRRIDKTPEPANLAAYIDVSSNQDAENWMTGVQNLKLTLRNRSSVAVSAAVVAVRYYTEQNDLLETKTVQVKNIPAGRSLTVAAPGHRLADHVDYELLSAMGKAIE